MSRSKPDPTSRPDDRGVEGVAATLAESVIPPVVLVVDDAASARRSIERQLEDQGYVMRFASTAAQARAALEHEVPDVVLLDVLLPDANGIEFCAQMRREPRLARVPVMMVTALDDRANVLDGLDAGANDFLIKPVFAPELRARLRNLLDAKRYRDLLERRNQAVRAEVERLRAHLLHMDRLATLGTFAAGVGHELGNVTGMLVTMSNLIAREHAAGRSLDPGDIEVLVSAAEHAADHARAITTLGAGPRGPIYEPVPLGEVARSVEAMLRVGGRTKSLSVDLSLPDEPVLMWWARTQLEQLFINLCTNAADAIEQTGQEGLVRIAVEPPDEQRVRIIISDDGSGMAPDVSERVFEPFFTTKPPGKGTGLGLPVIKELIESQGGTISVHTRVGEGTRVELRLPIRPESAG